MNILIVENEKHSADKICTLLKKADSTVSILAVLETVEGVLNWLEKNPAPDLIFMDIQLDDGLCFEIFEAAEVETPVIFTTAYDEYTLKAFRVNSIDYLLKPIDAASLGKALEKYRKLWSGRQINEDIRSIFREMTGNFKTRFLIRIGEKYRSVPVSEVSYFHICERSVFLRDINGKDYGIDQSLEKLQSMLDPGKFFRINRDCIVNIDRISLIHSYSASRLHLALHGEMDSELFVVSRDKVSAFKKWIDR
jgi:DNA-binding LytR/AlgR family response regulator